MARNPAQPRGIWKMVPGPDGADHCTRGSGYHCRDFRRADSRRRRRHRAAAGYLQALRDLARENDILFVADEVITAFGRLGSWFASDLWNLDPDLMTLAKGPHQRLPAARRHNGQRRDRRRHFQRAATFRTASRIPATRPARRRHSRISRPSSSLASSTGSHGHRPVLPGETPGPFQPPRCLGSARPRAHRRTRTRAARWP